MTAAWQRAFDKMEATLDQYLGEALSIVPMVRGDFASRIDSERPVIDVAGLAVEEETSSEFAEKMQTRISHEQLGIAIRYDELPPGAQVRKDDEVILLDRPRCPRMIVTRVARLDPGRLGLICGPVRGE